MSDAQKQKLNTWIELVYKLGTPLGLAALFFLKSQFATRDEVIAITLRQDRIESSIQLMIEQNKVNERQDVRLDDHETRMRALEARR